MWIFKTVTGRRLFYAVLILPALVLITGCAQEPAGPIPTGTRAPLPTLALKTVESDPTPTLSQNAAAAALPTPPITPSPTGPTATPSATPQPDERENLGERALEVGDYDTAVEQFSALLRIEPTLEAVEQADALLKLGRAYLADRRWMDAATIFNQLIALQGPDQVPAEVHFFLGQAYLGQEEFEPAIEAYSTYLDAEPEMGAYIQHLIADAYRALGDDGSVIAAYEAALESPAYGLHEIETRLLLAAEQLASGDTAAAIAQYDIVYDMAQTDATRGQMVYQAGAAELAAGNVDGAFERFKQGIEEYPEAYESYLGLVELVKAQEPVDDYSRGLVDYYAAAYAPAIEAFQVYIEANPDTYNADAHRYLALSHEALGDLDSAYADLEAYTAQDAQNGLLEQAKMRGRAGDYETAVTLYQQYLEDYPDAEEAPFAAWWLAALTEELGDFESASAHYIFMADSYPEHVDAPEALYFAGKLAAENEDMPGAYELWMRAAEEYPSTLYGSSALLDAVIAEPELAGAATPSAAELAQTPAGNTYQALRARDLATGIEPFAPLPPFVLPGEDVEVEEAGEAWLIEQFNLDPALVDPEPGVVLLADERLATGTRLWELGLFQEGKNELEALRQDFAEDPLSTYQLALFFRDLGLYRSSIVAAMTLLSLAETPVLDAPLLVGRLAYPIYYSDLIVPLAEKYGFDPRLQFSLIRQESLYESLARSGAAAQGLSQVIPDTGAWIAKQLQWPDYENEDLYKPYVGLNFGAYYLGQQLKAFDGDIHAALAAYNAGPGNAARWHKIAGDDLDLFHDTIDFWETRTYVERIYAGYDIYSQLYQPQ